MRRTAAVAGLIASLLSACGDGSDAPKFGAAQIVASIAAPVVIHSKNPSAQIQFADAATGEVFGVDYDGEVQTTFPAGKLAAARIRGLAVAGARLHVSYIDAKGGLSVVRIEPEQDRPIEIWHGETAGEADGRLAVDDDGLLIAAGGRIVRPDGTVVSAKWSGPVAVAVDQVNRLWAIDAGGNGERARVARGRTTDRAKRHRFATFLPQGAEPVAAAADEDNVYVCDAATKRVLRFYIGLDDVARRRPPLKGMRCRYDIAVNTDGSIVTATENQILRYPRR